MFPGKTERGGLPGLRLRPGPPPLAAAGAAAGDGAGGEFKLGRVLGKGGFGITYLALDVNLERRVAVKEFFPATLAAREPDQTTVAPSDERRFADWRRRFLDEAKALARLEHAHVVRVLRFFEAGGTAYMVMKYYEGETLAERLERVGRMNPPEAFAVMGPILAALEAAHAMPPHPLIHRDVKPANIFLLEGGRPVLLDFGAARHAAMGDDPKSLSVVLTPGFAPYEQYSHKGSQGPWTDVYGAAATLYRMATGEDVPDAVDRMVEDHLKPPHEAAPSIGRAFSAAVVRGLAVKPQDRPRTVREFREQLAAALGNSATWREEDVPTLVQLRRPASAPDSASQAAGAPTPASKPNHPPTPGPGPSPPAASAPAPIPAPSPITPFPSGLVVCPLCGKKNDPRETFQCRACKTDDLCLEHRDPKDRVCETCQAQWAEVDREEEAGAALREKRRMDEQKRRERNREAIRRSGELARVVETHGGEWDPAAWTVLLAAFCRKGWDPLDEAAVGEDLEQERAAWARRRKTGPRPSPRGKRPGARLQSGKSRRRKRADRRRRSGRRRQPSSPPPARRTVVGGSGSWQRPWRYP